MHLFEIANPAIVETSTSNAARLSYFQQKLREGDRAEPTVKKHLAHLRAALNWAKDQGMLTEIPIIKMPKRARTSKVMKGRPITTEEFERMLAKVETVLFPPNQKKHAQREPSAEWKRAVVESWRHYLTGLWWSGLRLGESLQLWWDGLGDKITVDTSGRYVMLSITAELEKGNQDRLYPVAPEFAEFLLATPEDQRTGPVFNPLSRRPSRSSRLSSRRVSRIGSEIGKAAGVKVTDKNGKVKFASAHDLRRSFGERWSRRVMPQVLMELMRHESIETTMRYYVGHNAEATAKELYAAVDQKGQQTGQHDRNRDSEQDSNNARSAYQRRLM